MNRSASAVACVRALAAQSRPPDLVVVADNVSTDGTRAGLLALQDLPFRLHVHAMPENLGNAGGVEAAMRIALDAGADAVWVLDDDSWPRPGALELLAAQGLRGDRVCHPLQVDPVTGRIAWPVPLPEGGGWRFLHLPDEVPPGLVTESRPSWTGSLFPREVILRVGPVNAALFLRGEDDDYALRAAALGVRFLLVGDAVLDHPGPAGMRRFRLFGKSFFWQPELADWKLYYQVRNAIWLKRHYLGAPAGAAVTLCHWLAELIGGEWSLARWKILAKATADGWLDQLGRRDA